MNTNPFPKSGLINEPMTDAERQFNNEVLKKRKAAEQRDTAQWHELNAKDLKRIGELENEVSNLRHDYAIVSAERNNLRAQAEALAEAATKVWKTWHVVPFGNDEMTKALRAMHSHLADYERSKQ